MAKNIQGKPQAGKVRQVRAESKISFPFPPSMLAAQITISALPERWILLPNPKKSLQRGVTEHPPRHSGHQVWPSGQATQIQSNGPVVPHPS